MRVHVGSRCPRPGCNGRVYQTSSPKYGPFLGCSNYPDCYAAWTQTGRRLAPGARHGDSYGRARQPKTDRGGSPTVILKASELSRPNQYQPEDSPVSWSYPQHQSTSSANGGSGCWWFVAAVVLFLVLWFVGVWVVQIIWG